MAFHVPLVHPIATKFPSMSDEEFSILVDDIRTSGQRKPVALYQGYLWDGRARVDACRRLGIQPKYWIIRREDPAIFTIKRHKWVGAPKSAERTEALKLFAELDAPEWKARARKEKQDWISEARREFRQYVSREPRPCDVCGDHIDFVHAHHSLPLNIQFHLGLLSAIHDHDWLCPLHHKVVHVYVSIYLTGVKDGEILDSLHPAVEPDWAKAEKVFNRGYELFKSFGGQSYSWARWHDAHS